MRSAAIGAALTVGVALLLSAQVAAVGQAVLRVVVTNALDIQGIPSPDQLVRIDIGTPYDIPPDKVFVLTTVVRQRSLALSGEYWLTVDGVEMTSGFFSKDANSTAVYSWGERIESGTIELFSGPFGASSLAPDVYLLGYLAD